MNLVLYIQDRLDALDADLATEVSPTRVKVLEGRKVELQWLLEYYKGGYPGERRQGLVLSS